MAELRSRCPWKIQSNISRKTNFSETMQEEMYTYTENVPSQSDFKINYFKETRCELKQAQEKGQYWKEEHRVSFAREQLPTLIRDVDNSPDNDLAHKVRTMSFEADRIDASTLIDEDPLNIIPYDQYVEDNEEHIVQSNVSSVRDDALMSILDEMHEQGVQSRLANKPNMVVKDSVTSELARYKELVEEYEKRPKFELTDREQ
ncbi:hypothetical protein Tco_0885966 [Tanacetum coccineum]